jgi:V/A-type H+/Na+-transporting ATPase subunit E
VAKETPRASGVQDLIARIRDDGVRAGKEEAGQIVAQARREAARLVADAKTEADAMRQKASAEIESFQHAALEALKMAARDSRLQLEASMLAAFQRQVKRLVAPITHEGSFVRALILVLAGHAVEDYLQDKPLQILVSDLLAGKERSNPELDKVLQEGVLGISGDMLRDGVEIIPSSEVRGGVRVRVVDEDLEIDLTEEAVSKLLLKHLLPRYHAILQGVE